MSARKGSAVKSLRGEEASPCFPLAKKPKLVEKSETEKELDLLWAELDAIKQSESEQHGSKVCIVEQQTGKANSAPLCKDREHHIMFDEEVGLVCKYCSHVALEVRYMDAPMLPSK